MKKILIKLISRKENICDYEDNLDYKAIMYELYPDYEIESQHIFEEITPESLGDE